MNLPPEPPGYGVPRPGYGGSPHPRRWMLVAGVAIAAIVGTGVVVWLLLPRPRGAFGYWYPLGGLFVVFLVIWLSFIAVRMAFWSSRRQRYWAARRNGADGPPHAFDPAIRTARLRYARGEITREQYEQIVSALRPRPPTP